MLLSDCLIDGLLEFENLLTTVDCLDLVGLLVAWIADVILTVNSLIGIALVRLACVTLVCLA